MSKIGPAEHALPSGKGSSDYSIMLPCEPEQFGEFISGLLGKPQTIEKAIQGAFEINKDDVISTFHLVDQRLRQQNVATLVQFTARVLYDDDSSVLLNSVGDFEHYAEIRPIGSVAVVMSWTYLVQFRNKNAPEKQEITLSFHADRNAHSTSDFYDDGFLVKKAWRLSMPAHVHIRVDHTERTWGVDIESLLTGHVKNFLIAPSKIQKFIYRRSDAIGLLVGSLFLFGSIVGVYVGSLRFMGAYLEELAGLASASASSQELLGYKVDFLAQVISSGAWPRFTFAAVSFLVVSLFMSIFLGAWVSAKANNPPSGFVVLSKTAEEKRAKAKSKIKQNWLVFYLSVVLSVVAGVVGNILFANYFAGP